MGTSCPPLGRRGPGETLKKKTRRFGETPPYPATSGENPLIPERRVAKEYLKSRMEISERRRKI